MIVDLGSYPIDPPEPTVDGGGVVWLMGRGLSMECGLTWREPGEWQGLPRMERIEKIKREVRAEMDSPKVNPAPIQDFLRFLQNRTATQWQHLFMTTNWDYLLQRELCAITGGLKVPLWLHQGAGSHVHHLNGSVEEETQHRSPIMLEDDCGTERVETTEANYAFNYLICERTFVVVGMSFACGTDRYLIRQVRKMRDWMPIGESHWIIVNPYESDLNAICSQIREALPGARVEPVKATLGDWRRADFPNLRTKGVFGDQPFHLSCTTIQT
jgi:hypothetical protein